MIFKTCLIQFSPIETNFLQDALLCEALNFDMILCVALPGTKCAWKPGMKKGQVAAAVSPTLQWMSLDGQAFSEDVDVSMSLICFTATWTQIGLPTFWNIPENHEPFFTTIHQPFWTTQIRDFLRQRRCLVLPIQDGLHRQDDDVVKRTLKRNTSTLRNTPQHSSSQAHPVNVSSDLDCVA